MLALINNRVLGHLARVMAKRGKTDLAITSYERLLRVHVGLPQTDSTDHCSCLAELATLYEEDGDTDKAADLKDRANRMLARLSRKMENAAEQRFLDGSSSEEVEQERSTDEGKCADSESKSGESKWDSSSRK
jgi:Tetratricopeptide repeat